MRGTIVKLFAAAVLLVAFSAACLYVGSRKAGAAGAMTQPENPLAQQFASDPGDGWMLAGGFLLLVALAMTGAGGMLWMREEKQ